MKSKQKRFHRPPSPGSLQSMRSLPMASDAGHPNGSRDQAYKFEFVSPLDILENPWKAPARPCLDPGRRFSIFAPLHSPYPLSSVSTPFYTTATPSPFLSVMTPSTRHTSLQPPSTQPSPIPSSLTPLPFHGTNPAPLKRARNYTPSPPNYPPTYPPEPFLERPAKKARMDKGSPSTAVNYRSSQVQVPSPLGQSSISAEIETQPEPEKKPPPPPPHPLAVDWNRPVKFVDPRPRACHLDLLGGRVPLPTYPDNPYPERSLDEELEGLVDTEVVKELADLMWKQQKRVWDSLGGYVDHYLLRPVPISPITDKSSESDEELDEEPVFVDSVPDSARFYTPVPRNNDSIHLGESLTNPNVIVLDEDEDDGFGRVLDLYRGAVQGSALSRELEIEVEDDVGYTNVGWEGVSCLELGTSHKSSILSSSGRATEPCTRAIAECKRPVEAESSRSPSGTISAEEEPPLGIRWSYSTCGYATGLVENLQKACRPQRCRQ